VWTGTGADAVRAGIGTVVASRSSMAALAVDRKSTSITNLCSSSPTGPLDKNGVLQEL
jgi:hypothetical protein